MAQVIDDTNKGTIKHLSILWMEKNEKNKIHLGILSSMGFDKIVMD